MAAVEAGAGGVARQMSIAYRLLSASCFVRGMTCDVHSAVFKAEGVLDENLLKDAAWFDDT